MPRWDDPEDDWDDDEPVDEDDDGLAPCPYCGREILEDSVRCPSCGSYISREDAPDRRKPWWILVGVIAGLYAVYRWTF
jgi:DNA-directed RNA polymerase subunit RPC12/RpoP